MIDQKTTVLIPSFKKSVAFQDDLVKNLYGVSLVQRSIDKAIQLGIEILNIHLLTDSEEIALIGSRNGVQLYLNQSLNWSEDYNSGPLGKYLSQATNSSEYTLILSPYAPLVETETYTKALSALVESDKDILKPYKHVNRRIFDNNGQNKLQGLFDSQKETHKIESKAFIFLKSKVFLENTKTNHSVFIWPVQNDLFEIESYQDWWVCEKLLQRKRIVFRIIGNNKIGTGHIYRALSLAHEITDHEILFVCDTENSEVVNKLAGYEYWLSCYKYDEIVESIITLKPDLVINDILSTSKNDVYPLKKMGIKVVNFEDIGAGTKYADMVINELYEEPIFEGDHILWGSQYFFIRDEFTNARAHRFKKQLDTILLTFGGTDQNDLTSKIFYSIKDFCSKYGIQVHIVTGSGYANFNKLKTEVDGMDNVKLTKATGVISSIMEKAQIAIVSNGRTVYELSHMNIPSIVISQHKREDTHNFACEENGFLYQGVYKNGHTEKLVLDSLHKLFFDTDFRKKLFAKTTFHNFSANKKRVLAKIIALIE